VLNGFTNNGALELTNAFASGAYAASLALTNGTLVNAQGASLSALPGVVGGGGRTLAAQLDNRGTLTVAQALTLDQPGAAHSNSGTITLSGGDLTVRQSGTNPSFTNTGTISISTGRTCTVSGGSLTQSSPGTVTGAGTLGLTNNATATFNSAITVAALNLSTATVSYTPDPSKAATALSLYYSALTVAGALTNAAGVTGTFTASTLSAAPFSNQGTLLAQGYSIINGAFTTTAGSVLRVQGALEGGGPGAPTLLNRFTNNRALELTNAFASGAYAASLALTNGTLVNAQGASLSALPGVVGGGGRTLAAQLDNRGTLTVAQALTLDQPGAAHSNSGTITLSGGDLTVRQSGTNPSFTNTGTISIGTGRTCTVSGGSLTQSSPGTVTGAGTLALTINATATFNSAITVAALNLSTATVSYAPDLSTAATALSLYYSALTAAGALTNATGVTLTVTNSTVSAAPFSNQGTLLAQGSSAINGAFTTTAGSVLRVQGSLEGGGSAALTVLNGVTNN